MNTATNGYDRVPETAPPHRAAQMRNDHDDTASLAAQRAVEAGSARRVEPAAVLRLQRSVGNSGVAALMDDDPVAQRSPVLDVVGKGGGTPLPTDVRTEMETGLGHDLGDVRVHDDDAAAASAQAVNAAAYTVGDEIVFNRGAYEPDTKAGRHTLAHELTHVVQQRSGPVDGTPTGDGVSISHPDDRFEREAETSAAALMSAPATAPATDVGPAAVQRHGLDDDLSTQALPLQRDEMSEEEELQALPLQRDEMSEEEELQALPLQRDEMSEEVEEEPADTVGTM